MTGLVANETLLERILENSWPSQRQFKQSHGWCFRPSW